MLTDSGRRGRGRLAPADEGLVYLIYLFLGGLSAMRVGHHVTGARYMR